MTVRPLLDDRYAPITSSIGFIKLPLDEAAEALAAWLRSLAAPVSVEPVAEPFPASLCRLLPLEIGTSSRELLVAHEGGWTAYFNCSASGTDPIGPMGYLAEVNRCDSVAIDVVPHRTRPDGRVERYGGVQFQLFGPHQTAYINYVRGIAAVHDGSRWQFITTGTPQPFERPEAYRARRIPDRFTSDLLAEYCAALGFRPLEPAAYGEARLVRSHPRTPNGIAEISLQQAQRNLGIELTEPCPAESSVG